MYLSLCKMKSWITYFVLIFCLKFIDGSQSFRCDYEFSSAAGGWFKHFVVPATWFDARLRCALEGAVLASPTTPEIEDEMTNITNSSETQQQYEIFTGIHATFPKGAYHTVEGIPLSELLLTWAPNEPDNKDNKESCLTMNSNGHLADLSCEETRPFICYRSASTEVKVNECGTVDPEYRLNDSTNKCYKFHTVARNFSRALLTCAAEGGHLAIINSDTEAGVLSVLFSQIPNTTFVGMNPEVAFIGFSDLNENGDWRTIHGQTLAEAGYSKFSPNQPSNTEPGQHCGAIYRTGELDDMFCDRIATFICEKSPEYDAACRPSSEVKVNKCGAENPEYRLNEATNKCYKFHTVAQNFSQALLACAAECGHLAIINSDTEAGVLSDLFSGIPNTTFVGMNPEVAFIGFSDLNENGDWRTIHGQTLAEAGYSKFSPNQPSNTEPGQHCGAIYRTGELDDMFCDRIATFICEKSPEYVAACSVPDEESWRTGSEVKVNKCGAVDPEYRLNEATNKCYKFHTVARNFPQALLACAAECGHLAIINSDTEAGVLSDLFSQIPNTTFVGMNPEVAFIGFSDLIENGDWRTIHGQTLAEAGYSKFSPNQPSNTEPGQHCGAIYRTGELDDMFCDRIATFICEKNPEYVAACSAPDKKSVAYMLSKTIVN